MNEELRKLAELSLRKSGFYFPSEILLRREMEILAKYSEEQPRDSNGRFASGGGEDTESVESKKERLKGIVGVAESLASSAKTKGTPESHKLAEDAYRRAQELADEIGIKTGVDAGGGHYAARAAYHILAGKGILK